MQLIVAIVKPFKMDEVKEDDIWNIDSIVKKNNKKTKKGVIRFAEDIEDLKS